MNFGKWIIVAYVLFAIFIGVLVSLTFRQDISLVSNDYYAQELVYQDQINRMKNAGALTEKPVATLSADGTLALQYSRLADVSDGKLELFRPSDSRLDHHFSFNQLPMQKVSYRVPDVARGLYEVNISWKMDGKEYFVEQRIMVQ